jgi:alanine racemase
MLGSKLESLRTWVEIDSRAVRKNCGTFRKIIGPKVKLWVVVKSNAYGHGLSTFAGLADKFGVDGFCVDSLVEGLRLRREGIKRHILVLGPTLPALYGEAAKNNITITISSFDALKALVAKKATSKAAAPEFHIKVDTGMHRQGFYANELPGVIHLLNSKFKSQKSKLRGIYTHFASAKDINYPTYTEKQFAEFQKAAGLFEKAGYKNLVRHAAATGGTLVDKKYRLDAVRLGIGLYGLWPSRELEIQLGDKIRLAPVLSWRAVLSEVKTLNAGDYVGYDLVERVCADTKMAIIPIGYWHGYPRSLSGIGEVIVNGHRARVLGRVSMDLLAVDVGGIRCKVGDVATLIGRDGAAEISAFEIAQKSGTTHYEFLTRLNPLMERVVAG